MLKVMLTLFLIFIISACSSVNFTTWSLPYSPTVQQGNYITDKMIAKLHVGMTKQQVLSVMDGAQPLTQFSFDSNIWLYSYQVYKNDDLVENREIRLTFTNDKVIKIFKKNSI
jgi:outer membrane protein assembly factor BamE